MRILVINYEFPPLGGGAGNASYFIARELAQTGHEISVLTSGFKGLPAQQVRDGITVWRVPVKRKHVDRCSVSEMTSFILSALAHSNRIVKTVRPQRCLVFFGIPGGPVGLWLKYRHGLPYVLSLRGGDVPGFLPGELGLYHQLTAALSRLIWKEARHVCANGEHLKELAQDFVPELKVMSIPNGVELVDNQATKTGGHGLELVFVGRLSPQKGLENLFEAIRILRQQNPEHSLHLSLAGDGPSRAALENQTRRLAIQDRITFLGWVDKDELTRVYRPGAVSVLPSLDEGLSNAALEAMAAGLPLIATTVLAKEGLIDQGVEGFLVEPGDAQALSKAIGHFLNHPEDILPMGRRAHDKVAKNFGWPAAAAAYAGLLEA